MAHFNPIKLFGILFTLLFSLTIAFPTDLTKRDSALDTLWRGIPKPQLAQGDSVLTFNIDGSTPKNAWGITYLHGCLGLMGHSQNGVLVSHFQEVGATGQCNLREPSAVSAFIRKLEEDSILFDFEVPSVLSIIYPEGQMSSLGVKEVRRFLQREGINLDTQVLPYPYPASSGVGDAEGSPSGKAVVQWIPDGASGYPGTLNVYWRVEEPRRSEHFDARA